MSRSQAKWKQKLTNHAEDQKHLKGKGADQNLQSMQLVIQIHNTDYSKEEILLSQDQFEGYLKDGDFLEIIISNTQSPPLLQSLNSGSSLNSFASPMQISPSSRNKKILLKLNKESLRKQNFQISILKQIADLHNLKANTTCRVRVVLPQDETLTRTNTANNTNQEIEQQNQSRMNKSSIEEIDSSTLSDHSIDKIEISFRDQLVSRRDMYFILQSLSNKAVFKGKQMEFSGIRFTVRALFNNCGQEMLTGVVQLERTKFTFYSKSCQVYILVELSDEMYQFDENGLLYSEKCIQFLKTYFERCNKSFSSHEVTLVVYTRLFYPQVKNQEELRKELTKFYKSEFELSDEEIDKLGAFQISKHTKVFQDMFLKVGVIEIQRNNWEKQLQNLKKLFNYLPSMLNWEIDCPQHVKDMKKYYNKDNLSQCGFFSSMEDIMKNRAYSEESNHYLLNCKLGNAEKQNILEAINLSLFNLNNEEEDQNLKQTGQQLLIITAGYGSYRINANIVQPTKNRVLLGGIPISLISLNRRPPYKTPLLINCCTYTNPFKTKFSQNPGFGLMGFDQSMLQKMDARSSIQEPSSVKEDNKTYPPYFYPYWIDITYIPQMKVLETHSSILGNPCQALYNVQKFCPKKDYQPHMSFSYLATIAQMEEKMNKEKNSELGKRGRFESQQESFKENGNISGILNDKLIIKASDYTIKQSKMNDEMRKDLMKQLEREDLIAFNKKEKILKSQRSEQMEQNQKLFFSKLNPGGKSSMFMKNRGDKLGKRSSSKIEFGVDYDNATLREEDKESGSPNIQEQTHEEDEESKKIDATNSSVMAFSVQEKKTLDLIPDQDSSFDQSPGNRQTSNKLSQNQVVNGSSTFNYTMSISIMSPTQQNQQMKPARDRMMSIGNPSEISPKSQAKSCESPFLFNEKKETINQGMQKSQPLFNLGRQPQQFQINPISTQSQLGQQVSTSCLRNRWQHQSQNQGILIKLTESEMDALVELGNIQQIELVMEGFWKSLTECKILPLTTDYYPSEYKLRNQKKYNLEISQANVVKKKNGLIQTVEQYLNEYICLRLTQNFQMITPDATCNINTKNLWKNDLKMGMGHKFNVLKYQEAENFDMETFTKMDTDTNTVKQADFKYMLFNYHINKFQSKKSEESRLFNFKSLANLGEVLNDFRNAMNICIKMPSNHFVMFHPNPNWVLGYSSSNIVGQRQQLVFNADQLLQTIKNQINQNSLQAQLNSQFMTKIGPYDGSFNYMNLPEVQPSLTAQYSHLSFMRLDSIDDFKNKGTQDHQNFFQSVLQQKQTQINSGNPNLSDNFEQDIEDIELAHFMNMKQQVFEMLTRNQKSQFNTKVNLAGLNSIQLAKPDQSYDSKKIQSTTAYIEDDNGEKVNGVYFLSTDDTYHFQHCFHLVILYFIFEYLQTIQWIFANGPQISQKINSLKRKVRDCGFQIVQISGIANRDELNPLESFTILKNPPPSLKFMVYHKNSMDSTFTNNDDDIQTLRVIMFQKRIEHFLRSYYGFVIESIDLQFVSYIHNTGLAILRVYHNSQVAWIENDVVNNQMVDYNESNKLQEKVSVLIFAIDTLLDIVFDKILQSDNLEKEFTKY